MPYPSYTSLLSQARRSEAANTAQEMERGRNSADPFWRMNRSPQTVLRDPRWQAYFQSLSNAGVDRLADSSVGAKRGMWGQQSAGPSTIMDPSIQDSALATNPSNAINARNPYAMQALQGAYGAPIDEGGWISRSQPARQRYLTVQGQRGGPKV